MNIYNESEQELLQERNENFARKGIFGIEPDENGDFPSPGANENKKARRYTISKKGIAIVTSLCLVFSCLFGFGGAMVANSLTGSSVGDTLGQGLQAGRTGTDISNADYNLASYTGSDLTIQEIIALTENSVVEIRTEKVATDPWMRQYVTAGAGSGVIVSKNGYIVTNNHVVDGASKIMVTLKNGKEYTAELMGTDSQTDIAVIKIEASDLTAAVYGNSDNLQVGDLAVAIGNPLGELGGTATAGIVSALDRDLNIDGKDMTLLQIDAAISPGNSGGGVFNQNGELIGIVVAKSSGSDVEGLGFAIPINQAKTVAQQLVDHGYVKGRAAIGITMVDLTAAQDALYYGVRNTGIYVKSVDGQNAKSAGLQEGDMLYYVGDTKIQSTADVTSALAKYSSGDKVKITVVRSDKTVDLTVTLSEKTN